MARHHGSCHCGAVDFEVELELDRLVTCNCSMCGRSGTILAFVPAAAFTLNRGSEALKDYQFGKHHIHHTFCTTCGVKPFAHGANPDGQGTTYAVNVRCLDDVDVFGLTPHQYDGKAL